MITNLIKSQSAAGLSVTAAYGEVIMYSNAAFYNLLRGNPFTAYGETLVVVFQTMVVVGLIWWFSRDGKDRVGVEKMGLVVGGYLVYLFVVFRGKSLLVHTVFYFTLVSCQLILIFTCIIHFSTDTRHSVYSNGVQSTCSNNITRLTNHCQPETKADGSSKLGHNGDELGRFVGANSYNNQGGRI